MRFIVAMLVVVSSVLAQHMSPVLRPRASTLSPRTMVWSDDLIFPHLAFGGGWETQFVVVNMSDVTVSGKQQFFDPSGKAITVTYRTVPDGAVTTSTYGAYNILLFDNGGSLQTGWSELVYTNPIAATSHEVQLGGSAIFRSHIAGRPDFEAVVPIGAYDDPAFFLPFDNSSGYVTSMAMVNPDFNSSTSAHLDFVDYQGNFLIAEQSVALAAGQQVAFALTDQYPDLAGKVGVLYVWGDTNYLSGLGFRFNPGGAFATVPIMNWICMFQTCQ